MSSGQRPELLCGASPTLRVMTSPTSLFQENERTRDLIIEQRFHRTIIGQKGERIREIRDKFPEVTAPVSPAPGSHWTGTEQYSILGFLPVIELGLLMVYFRLSSTSQTQHKKVILSNSEGPRMRWKNAPSTCRRWWQIW